MLSGPTSLVEGPESAMAYACRGGRSERKKFRRSLGGQLEGKEWKKSVGALT
jgi:hypothetical protein